MNTKFRVKLLKNLVLLVSVVYCCNAYTSEEKLQINDFTADILKDYSIDNNTGLIYKEDKENNKIYPTYDNYKCYDLKTVIEKDNFLKNSNLIVKNCDNNVNNKYTMNYDKELLDIPENCNVIIPENITLTKDNSRLNFINNNCNLICLGSITTNNNLSLVEGKQVKLIVFGNKSISSKEKYIVSNIYTSNNIIKYVFYPGSKIIDNNNEIENEKYITLRQNGILYLNRYDNENQNKFGNDLQGIIHNDMHIIYNKFAKNSPENDEDNSWDENYKLQNTDKYDGSMNSKYFQKLYWKGTDHEYSTEGDGKYHFENPELPLSFNDDGSGKNILGLNPSNDFAKYDIAFWDKCSVDDEDYGLLKYNNNSPECNYGEEAEEVGEVDDEKEFYINVDTIENLFHDGKTYCSTGLLKNMPNEIYFGLIGNKDLIIKDSVDKLTFYGDNEGYDGVVYLYPTVKQVFFGDKSIVKIGESYVYTYIKDNVLQIMKVHTADDIKFYDLEDNEISDAEKINKIKSGQKYSNLDSISNIEKYNNEDYFWIVDENNDNFIDKCFKDGSGLSKNMPSIIKSGLIGNKNSQITINNPINNEIELLGDNRNFLGKLNITSSNTNPENKSQITLKIYGNHSLLKVNYDKQFIDLYYHFDNFTNWDINKFGNDINVNLINTNNSSKLKIIDTSNNELTNKKRELIISGTMYSKNYNTGIDRINSNVFFMLQNPINELNSKDGTNINEIHFTGENSLAKVYYNNQNYISKNLNKVLTYVFYQKENLLGEVESWYNPHWYTNFAKDCSALVQFRLKSYCDSNPIIALQPAVSAYDLLLPIVGQSGFYLTKVSFNKDNTEFHGLVTVAPWIKTVEYDRNCFIPTMKRLDGNSNKLLDSKDLNYEFIGNNIFKLDKMNKVNTEKTEKTKDDVQINSLKVSNNANIYITASKNRKKLMNLKISHLELIENSRIDVNNGINLVIGKKSKQQD